MFSAQTDSHEPMLSSPTSPGIHQYLPGYLLGDSVMQHGFSPAAPRLWSTGGQSPQKNTSFTSPPAGSAACSQRDMSRIKEKGGAPPVKSLFLSPGSDNSFMLPNHQSFASQLPPRGNSAQASRGVSPGPPTAGLLQGTPSGRPGESFAAPMSKIPTSPAQMDPFYTQGENLKSDDILDETWITVFGFPPAATSSILQQFSRYGNILKHVSAMEGNWMHIHYQSKIQAKKALSKNGKVFGNSLMIGVLPCIDKSLMDDQRDNLDCITTPVLQARLEEDMSHTAKTTPIRQLTSAYQAARSDFEVSKGNQQPQKDNSFMSKVKEYMLGW